VTHLLKNLLFDDAGHRMIATLNRACTVRPERPGSDRSHRSPPPRSSRRSSRRFKKPSPPVSRIDVQRIQLVISLKPTDQAGPNSDSEASSQCRSLGRAAHNPPWWARPQNRMKVPISRPAAKDQSPKVQAETTRTRSRLTNRARSSSSCVFVFKCFGTIRAVLERRLWLLWGLEFRRLSSDVAIVAV